jgi:DNA repair protein RecO (recombination protein O)
MGRLTHVEQSSAPNSLSGTGLLAGFYLNELLLRLVPRGDPNEQIMNCYSNCLDRLADPGRVPRALRLFELELLEALGVGIDLERDYRSGEPIEPDLEYLFEHESGLTASGANATMTSYNGKHLISLREHRLDDDASLRAARQLLAAMLHAHLGARPLKTRAVARELAELGLSG